MWSNIWNILNTVILYQNLSNISNDSARYHDYHQNATTTTIATISTSISERQSHTTIRSHSHQQFTRRNGIVHISDGNILFFDMFIRVFVSNRIISSAVVCHNDRNNISAFARFSLFRFFCCFDSLHIITKRTAGN